MFKQRIFIPVHHGSLVISPEQEIHQKQDGSPVKAALSPGKLGSRVLPRTWATGPSICECTQRQLGSGALCNVLRRGNSIGQHASTRGNSGQVLQRLVLADTASLLIAGHQSPLHLADSNAGAAGAETAIFLDWPMQAQRPLPERLSSYLAASEDRLQLQVSRPSLLGLFCDAFSLVLRKGSVCRRQSQ